MKIEEIKQDIVSQKQHLRSLSQCALDKAKKFAEDADVTISHSKGINVSVRLGETENIELNNDSSLSITLYNNGKRGSASTNVFSNLAIEKTVEVAANIMQYTGSDPCSGLGDKNLMAFDAEELDLFYPSDFDITRAIEIAKLAENKALSYEKISQSDGSQYYSGHGLYVYGNTHGMLENYATSRYSLSCSMISEQDGVMERNYAYTTARDWRDLVPAEQVGNDAASRTLAHLGAKQIKTTRAPVIFSYDIAGSLFGHLACAIDGNALYRQSSFLLASLGESLFPAWFSIYEDPHIIKGLGSAAFDNEGIKTQPRDIIKSGTLMTYLLNNYSARKLDQKTTGHAGGIYNWQFSINEKNLSALLKRMNRGLLVTSLMGQGVNLITGDYSRGAAGFWVENGEITFPVNEITIAGNLKTMFANIIAMSNDIEVRSNIKTGSILIEEMSIAGK